MKSLVPGALVRLEFKGNNLIYHMANHLSFPFWKKAAVSFTVAIGKVNLLSSFLQGTVC